MFLRKLAKHLGLVDATLDVEFIRNCPSWMAANLPSRISPSILPQSAIIEKRARMTQRQGERPLWSGYRSVTDYPRSTTGGRSSEQVRTDRETGRFYSWLVQKRRPDVVVEFGTAFGVSGMYWLAGLEQAESGHLFTFEPNADWAALAERNLSTISKRFTLSVGTFESLAESVLGDTRIDLALVDAIHTSVFVFAQYDILRPLMSKGGIVLFDDINFSEDMSSCWQDIANRPEIVASATLGQRVGIVEFGSAA